MSEIDEELREAARAAKCVRCKESIVDSSSLTGTVLVNYYIPAVDRKERHALCGMCGILFRQFLHPELEVDPTFRAAAAMLRVNWAVGT